MIWSWTWGSKRERISFYSKLFFVAMVIRDLIRLHDDSSSNLKSNLSSLYSKEKFNSKKQNVNHVKLSWLEMLGGFPHWILFQFANHVACFWNHPKNVLLIWQMTVGIKELHVLGLVQGRQFFLLLWLLSW